MTDFEIPAMTESVARSARAALQLQGPLLASWAPGRVNLIGEHTDYNDGWVLPITIARVIALVGQVHPDDLNVRLYSTHYAEMASFDARNAPTAKHNQGVPLWARYIAGVLGELQQMGLPICGFSAAIDGDIPTGSGMSSSAAIVIATLTWLNEARQMGLSTLDLARIGQLAEQRGMGVRVGILDHAASVFGMPGNATLIDCRSLDYRYIPFNLSDTRLIICDSGVERSLATSAYNERRAQCEKSARIMATSHDGTGTITSLRDVTWVDYLRLAGRVPQPARRRMRHVITENQRTLDAQEALQRDDAVAFGRLLLESHASLRDDFAVSCDELDAIVDIAMSVPETLGARMIGGGFGGSVLILVRSSGVEAMQSALLQRYPERTQYQPTITQVIPTGGPGVAWLDAPITTGMAIHKV